jgi:hypothetical protein
MKPALLPIVAIALILGLHFSLFALDPMPRYYFGDSAAYLWAVRNDGPEDRSWTYPYWFLRPLFSLHSMRAIVLVQCALGAIPSILCWKILSEREGTSPYIALGFAALAVVEPLALAYQRFLLTDSIGLVTVAAALYLCVSLVDRKPRGLVAAAIAPSLIVLAASWRSSQAPILALLSLAVALILGCAQRRFVVLTLFVGSLAVCQTLYSKEALKIQHTAGYNAASGRFLLGAMLPIVTRDDIAPYVDPIKAPALLDPRARDRRERANEMFGSGGAIEQLRALVGNVGQESWLDGHIATHAVFRAPLQAAQLGLENYLDYFDPVYFRERIEVESGRRSFDPGFQAYLAQNAIVDVEDPWKTWSLTGAGFRAASAYYGLIPAIAALVLVGALAFDRTPSTILLAAFSFASAASQILLSTEPVPRYLIVAAWVNIVVLGRLTNVLWRRFGASG